MTMNPPKEAQLVTNLYVFCDAQHKYKQKALSVFFLCNVYMCICVCMWE